MLSRHKQMHHTLRARKPLPTKSLKVAGQRAAYKHTSRQAWDKANAHAGTSLESCRMHRCKHTATHCQKMLVADGAANHNASLNPPVPDLRPQHLTPQNNRYGTSSKWHAPQRSAPPGDSLPDIHAGTLYKSTGLRTCALTTKVPGQKLHTPR